MRRPTPCRRSGPHTRAAGLRPRWRPRRSPASLTPPDPAAPAVLRRAHTAHYVHAVQTGQPAADAASNGFAWTPETWTGVTASTGGVVAAAQAAVARRQHTGSLSSGLHH